MFCEKCGAAVPDGVKFCPACGSNMTAQTVSEPQPAAQPSPAANSGFSPVPVKKRKKWWIGALAAAGVVICAVLLCVFVFPRDVQHLLLGDEGYVKYLAKQSAVRLAENTAEATTAVNEELSVSMQMTPTVEFGSAFEESGWNKEQLEQLAQYLNTVKLRADMQKGAEDMKFEYRADDADGTLLSLQGSIEKDNCTFRIPEFSESYMELAEDYSALFTQNEIDAQKLSQSLRALADTYVEALENADYSYKEDAKLKVHGISVEADCAIIEFDGADAAELLISLLETAREDEYLEELLAQSFEMQPGTDYRATLDQLIDQLKNSKKELKNSDAKLEIALYLNAQNQCVGMEYSLTAEGSTASLKVIPGKKLTSDQAISLEINNKEIFYATWESEKNTANGEVAFNLSFFNGASQDQFIGVRYEAEDLKTAEFAGDSVFAGTITFRLYDPDDLLGTTLGNNAAEMLKEAKMIITAAAEKDVYNATVKIEEETLGSLGFSMQISPQTQFSETPEKTAENTYTLDENFSNPAAEEELDRGITAWIEALQSRPGLNNAAPAVSEKLEELLNDPAKQLVGSWYGSLDISESMGSPFSIGLYFTVTEDGKMSMTVDSEQLRSDYKEYLLNSINELFTPEQIQQAGASSAEELLQITAYQQGYFSTDAYIRALCEEVEESISNNLFSNVSFTCEDGKIIAENRSIPYTIEEDILNLDGVYFRRKV